MADKNGLTGQNSAATPQRVERPNKLTLPVGMESLKDIGKGDLKERRLRPEWMDQPDVDPVALQQALTALESYNWISAAWRGFWAPIRKLALSRPQDEIRVLDVACGGGDIAVNLARVAKRSKLKVTVDGCDLTATAVAVSTQRAERAGVSSRFFQFDVTKDVWPTDYDVICSSLFLHHLPTPIVETVLGQMGKATRHMVLANDLIRSRIGYLVLRIGTLIVTRSPLARYDGPVSVAGAFTPAELEQMATQAGLTGVKVSQCWPERMILEWHKQ